MLRLEFLNVPVFLEAFSYLYRPHEYARVSEKELGEMLRMVYDLERNP